MVIGDISQGERNFACATHISIDGGELQPLSRYSTGYIVVSKLAIATWKVPIVIAITLSTP